MVHATRLGSLLALGFALAAPACFFNTHPHPCAGRCSAPTPLPDRDSGPDTRPPRPTDTGPTEPFDPSEDAVSPLDDATEPPDDRMPPPPPDPTVDCAEPRAFSSSPERPAEYLREAIVGRWRGLGVRPEGWTGPETFPVEFEFARDGTYAVFCDAPECVGLYYGSDGEGGGRGYRLRTVSDTGEGVFDISVRFEAGNLTAGALRRVSVWNQGNGLGFEFAPEWLGPRSGVMQYSLRRVCDPATGSEPSGLDRAPREEPSEDGGAAPGAEPGDEPGEGRGEPDAG